MAEIKRSVYNSLDKYIFHKIRYEYLENPKQNYDNLVKYLKSVFRNKCSSSCVYGHFFVHRGYIKHKYVLNRRTPVVCSNCSSQNVSEYSHDYCFNCAPEDTLEHVYYHYICKN